MLELKKDKDIDYVLSWKSKGIYTFKLTLSYTTLFNNTKFFGHRAGIKLDNRVLVVEQNNYTSKIINVYIVYDIDTWPKNPLNNFTLKNCLLGATNTVKNNNKEKCVYSGYGISFDGVGE